MAIYLGSNQKLKIRTVDGVSRLIVPSFFVMKDIIKLKSFDNYILTDSNGVYLTAKEDK